MKTIFSITSKSILISTIICLYSCCKSAEGPNNITYYYRDQGSNNNFATYNDYLIVNNYKDGLISIKEFAEIGRKYIDTVKASLPVSGVTFIGKNSCSKLPKAGWEYWEKQRKFMIIDIGFENNFERNKDKNKKDLKISFIGIYGRNDRSYTVQSDIDSLLSLKTKLFTGF